MRGVQPPTGAGSSRGDSSGTVTVWDATTGRVVRTLGRHTATVYGLAFSPDGRLLASASEDRTVKVWDATTGELVHRPSTDTSGGVARRGLQPRRPAPRLGELDSDREGLGRGDGPADPHPPRTRGPVSRGGLQPRRPAPRLGQLRQDREGLGPDHRPGAPHPRADTPSSSSAWRSAPTAGAWPRPARIRP